MEAEQNIRVKRREGKRYKVLEKASPGWMDTGRVRTEHFPMT